jgi:hypothetical protein
MEWRHIEPNQGFNDFLTEVSPLDAIRLAHLLRGPKKFPKNIMLITRHLRLFDKIPLSR